MNTSPKIFKVTDLFLSVNLVSQKSKVYKVGPHLQVYMGIIVYMVTNINNG